MNDVHFGSQWVDFRGHFSVCSCGWKGPHRTSPETAAVDHDAHLDAVRDWIPGSHAYIRDAGARAQRIVDEHRSTPRHPVEQG